MNNAIIRLENLNKSYFLKRDEFKALKDINMEVDPGEFIMIMGKSGSGKTTLMNILSFLDNYQSGKFIFMGEDTSNFDEKHRCSVRNQHMGFVFQQFHLIDSLNVFQNIELPLLYSRKYSKEERKKKVLECLQLVKLEEKANNMTNELSGGQQQRVAIARALINSPSIIFADEPTGALDSENSEIVMGIFHDLHKSGKTIVMVTHDEELTSYSTRVVRIKDGRIKEEITNVDS
ncbi:MAG: ABC transporter ATP-binding protein [Clostridium sp.]|nr:ABC transporter ATP-binding protein [Clostridium sp.]